MTNENLKNYLKNLGSLTSGIETDKWIRFPELNYIILESDANQFYNPLTQKIQFDTTHGLIRIKYSPLIPITAPVQQFSYNTKNKSINIYNGFGSVYSYKQIREPKIGDYFCAFCAETDTDITSSLITNIKRTSNGTQIIVNDDKIFKKIELQKRPMNFFIVLQGVAHFVELTNPIELYSEIDTDDTFSDIYIDITKIIGFEFDKNWRPNNL